MTDWTAVIEQRRSVRRYSCEPLSAETLGTLRRCMREAAPLDERVSLAFELTAFERIGSAAAVGAMPIFTTAPWYLVAHGPAGPGRMAEIGFRMEQVILAATSLHLGTCWIGGFFNARVLAPLAECPKEDIVAISPVGYAEKGRLRGISYAIGEFFAYRRGKRKPLTDFCFWQSWGRALQPMDVSSTVYQALEMARLAPSWSNVQPWCFLAREGEVYAFADSRPKRTNNRPKKPYYELDTGIAMSHFWLAMGEGDWEPLGGRRPEGLEAPEWAVPLGRYEV